VWLKRCNKTVSVIFRFGEQEECLFPVLPSPQNPGCLRQGKKSSNPELVCQLPLNDAGMLPDPLCERASTATAVTLQHFNSILSFQTAQRHRASQLKHECSLLVRWIDPKTWLLKLRARITPSPVAVMGI